MTWVELVDGAATPRQQRLVAVGTELLHRRWPGIRLRTFALPDDDAVLLVQPVRGGVSLFVAPDESVMFFASAIEPGAALELFRSGMRTDKANFDPTEPEARESR
ncbi:hypothetical protein [Occultella gossypii]|uniref:Uncharacterized protein n=1 Tax=Occultella gossypii TaxID=2800820 RepID=A0ABS7S4P6_9MICO|nr:hypothetical protein [Occultella gossypii]MBZ2195314.1 hypothetical protein [Occultella gossypii]